MKQPLALACAIAALAPMVGHAVPSFRSIDLGTLGGSISYATSVSTDGTVVGTSQTTSGAEHAFIWKQETGLVDLGTLGGCCSYATRVSENGTWVIGSSVTPDGSMHGFVWTRASGMVDLTKNLPYSWVRGVNNQGMVIGGWQSFDDPTYHGFVWTRSAGLIELGSFMDPIDINNRGLVAVNRDGGTVTEKAYAWSLYQGLVDLDPNGVWDITEANAVNDHGIIVGGAIVCNPRPCNPDGSSQATVRAFGWTTATGIVDLDGGNSGSSTIALGITDQGLVAGRLTIFNSLSHVFVKQRTGELQDIGTLGGFGTELYDVNDSTVVGISQIAGASGLGHAFAWSRGDGMVDLGRPDAVSVATAVNGRGLIVGEACAGGGTRPTGCHATVWTRRADSLDRRRH